MILYKKIIGNFVDYLSGGIFDLTNTIGKNEIENFIEKIKPIELGFNVFTLISDTYYKENFHSYIIKGILDITIDGEHIFIHLLIDIINKNNKNNINKNNFLKNNIVEREKHRFDISIKNYLVILCVMKIDYLREHNYIYYILKM